MDVALPALVYCCSSYPRDRVSILLYTVLSLVLHGFHNEFAIPQRLGIEYVASDAPILGS